MISKAVSTCLGLPLRLFLRNGAKPHLAGRPAQRMRRWKPFIAGRSKTAGAKSRQCFLLLNYSPAQLSRDLSGVVPMFTRFLCGGPFIATKSEA